MLAGCLAASAHANCLTGFEVSDGFTVGGAWPTEWTPLAAGDAGVRIGTTWAHGGSQSLEVGLHSAYNASIMRYTPTTRP